MVIITCLANLKSLCNSKNDKESVLDIIGTKYNFRPNDKWDFG